MTERGKKVERKRGEIIRVRERGEIVRVRERESQRE